MSIVAKKGAQRELVPSGSHVARCIKVMHFGHIPNIDFHGRQTMTDTVRITWELPHELRVFDEDKGEQPMSISKDYTVSLGDKANLRKDLEGWRGRGFTQEELDGFDILNILGAPCMLSIIHKQAKSSGNNYDNVVGVSPLPKGTQCPENINPLFVWDYNQNYDEGVLENLHEYFQDKIKSSEEYQAKQKVGQEFDKEPEDIQDAPMPGLDDVPPEDYNDLPF